MAALSSISLRFVSLFALVVALASSGPAFPSAPCLGGSGSVSLSDSILDACGGVTIGCVSFSGSFAPFDGGEVPMIAKGGFLFFSGSYLGEGDGVGFPSAAFIVDNLVLLPALLVVAALGWPLVVGGWLWIDTMAVRVSSVLSLDLGFFFMGPLVYSHFGPRSSFYFFFLFLLSVFYDG